MKKRRRMGRRTDKTGLKFGLGIFGVVVFLAIALGAVVVSDNNRICNEIGLSGFLQDKCFAKSGYEYKYITMVVGNTANTPVPKVNKEVEQYLSANLIKKDSELVLFSATSDNKRMSTISPEFSDDDGLEKQVKEVKTLLSKINNETLLKKPTSSGATYLESITRAARSMQVSEKEKGVIIVLGSGLSDGGFLNFADTDLLHADIDDIRDTINDSDDDLDSKSLKNITIIWSGIGETIIPQIPLDDDEISKLKEIYRIVLKEKMGAENVKFVSSYDGDEMIDTDYTVKTVKTSDSCLWCDPNGISLSEKQLEFNADSDKLKDENSAKQTLASLIDDLNEKDSRRVMIEGYVAKYPCNAEPDNDLATRRANSVKDLLISMGVSGNRIEASGKGKGPNDECPNGVFNKDIASRNRYIKIWIKE